MSVNEIKFFQQSFKYLSNISSIVLMESSISNYKCIFMHELERDVKRNISNKYVFYKSINLLSLNFTFNATLKIDQCDLVFHLFQLKIHMNLKSDKSFELFLESCEMILIKNENKFNRNKEKCNENFDWRYEEIEVSENGLIDSKNNFLKVFSNFYYLLSMISLLILLGPAFWMILRYDLFSKLRNNSQNGKKNKEIALEKLHIEIGDDSLKVLNKPELMNLDLSVGTKPEELSKKIFTTSTRLGHDINLKFAIENEKFSDKNEDEYENV